jgi:CheY-like chemotaxis protein
MLSNTYPEKNSLPPGPQPPPDSLYFENPQKLPGQYTVFLVEDDIDDRLQIMKALQRSPFIYNIRCFENGVELKQHLVDIGYFSNGLLRNIPTLILLDIHMPGGSGMRVLRDLKNHPLTRKIPVVIVTGDTSSETTSEAFRLKANAYVAKPIHLDHIHKVMSAGNEWSDV